MRPDLVPSSKLAAGDRVAVVSPSFAAPGKFPWIHELAMHRLREEFGLEPVEYPTTRRLGASPQDRASDLTTAFCDPTIRAVLATIGGDDELTILPFLEPEAFAGNRTPFIGYSDNTNLLNWLWNLGVTGYHGGSTMVHIGRPGGLHPVSEQSLHAALFTSGDIEIEQVDAFSEDELDWSDRAAQIGHPPTQPAGDWIWHRPDRVVTGPTWGGNLEVLHWNLAVSRWIRPVGDYAGCVLLLETSEAMPNAEEVFWMLRSAGERGLLAQFPAAIVGRPKATAGFGRPASFAKRERYRSDQRRSVLRAFQSYAPDTMLVFGVDIGHTDPQWILPYGGTVTVDGPGRRIIAHY
ncbi:MAG: S66 family peptidase [Candidatus Dormibacteria bacterium]